MGISQLLHKYVKHFLWNYDVKVGLLQGLIYFVKYKNVRKPSLKVHFQLGKVQQQVQSLLVVEKCKICQNPVTATVCFSSGVTPGGLIALSRRKATHFLFLYLLRRLDHCVRTFFMLMNRLIGSTTAFLAGIVTKLPSLFSWLEFYMWRSYDISYLHNFNSSGIEEGQGAGVFSTSHRHNEGSWVEIQKSSLLWSLLI